MPNTYLSNNETMEILKVVDKGIMMDIYVYKHSKTIECINEEHITNSNVLFDLL
jgi:hypothetical protein